MLELVEVTVKLITNEIVYKSRDGFAVGKPNTNVLRHVVKGKAVKFNDIII